MADDMVKKEITVKRVSAFKFEVEVSVGVSNTQVTSVESSKISSARRENPVKSDEFRERNEGQNRISVIRRAPPSASSPVSGVHRRGNLVRDDEKAGRYMCERRFGACQAAPSTAILINDAILYRIIGILLWKVLGEENLTAWGYPTTPTYQLLSKVVYYFSCFQPGVVTSLQQDHDCQGDINCFMEHVGDFLNLCAPTQEIKEKFGWCRLSREQILKKIYYEDLLPLLRKTDLTNCVNILDSHNDILRLLRWQEQGFTAISWNGHEHFSRLKSRFPWCPRCCRRLRKSVISY